MSQTTTHNKNMKDLMTMSGYIKSAGLPSLGYPFNIKHSSNRVKNSHHNLISKSHNYFGVSPVEVHRVSGRNDTREAHGEEDGGPEGAVAGGREGGREEGGDGEEAEGGDGGEVEEAGEWVAVEGVEDGSKERGDDHEGDSRVIEAPEEEIEGFGVTSEEVGDGAAD
ncbi:hypothetical protein E3N88_17634 [Mikania micrantha]|uniref:Uncharacterized protein n=1 Tax=Mikania micrantha TaxID=192012 RepID=A0A5N6NV56_9ASTR|nr:hypothetical protein E3N88_17634 [Mikania micrantha]